MKKIISGLLTFAILICSPFLSCKKERSCENCNAATNKSPIAIAKPDTIITLPCDSILLDGSSSFDPDGTISSWSWKKISGPSAFNIVSSITNKTFVKNLVAGQYDFELKVTDNGGLSAADTVRLTVDSVLTPNHPPVAYAGTDTTITLPVNSINLDGSGSTDPDNNISSYQWTKISGPSPFNLTNANTVQTQVTNLVVGIYQFELKVTDSGGLSAADTVRVTVDAALTTNQPPVANAGPDQAIILPTNSALVDGGNSTDPDNNITTYLWTKISGPATFTIVNPNSAFTQISNLVQGVYQFELKVTDAGGLFDKDTMVITVNNIQPLPPCDTNRPLIYAQLIPVGVLSDARVEMTVAAAGNKILFAGGWKLTQFSESSRVDIFDVVANTWSTSELSVARVWSAGIAAGNKIFFAGGQNDGDSYPQVDIYDVSSNTWSLSYLSRAADNLAAATVGNKVLFAGGNYGINAVNTVDVYDLSNSMWTTASLSAPRNYIAAVSANNKAYFTGGDPWTGQTSNVIDIYDAASGTWSTSNLQVQRAYHAAIANDNILYFGGGSMTGSNAVAGICSVETLNTNTGTRTLMNLSAPAAGWSADAGWNAVVKDNKIIFPRNGFDIYDTQTNTWSIGVLPQPFPDGASIFSFNNTIYVAGGLVNGVLSNQVWKLEF